MNLPNKFTHIFPSDECDLRDAVEALVDKIEGYSCDGLFLHTEFVQCFAKKIIHIIEKMPQHQKRREIEEELAYIFRHIRERHQLILIGGALVPAENAGVINTPPQSPPGVMDSGRDAMRQFVYGHLRHIREQAEHSLGSFIRYLSLIREYSQQGEFAIYGIEDHIEDATWNYSYQELEDMIQSYDYGVTTEYSLDDWERDIMKE